MPPAPNPRAGGIFLPGPARAGSSIGYGLNAKKLVAATRYEGSNNQLVEEKGRLSTTIPGPSLRRDSLAVLSDFDKEK